jgi:hypothetical protein
VRASINVNIKDGPKKGTEVFVNAEDYSLADDEGLVSVINPKNTKDTVFVKRAEITINPQELKPSKSKKEDKPAEKPKDKKEDDLLAGLGL